MEAELFESLLYQDESEALDFKLEQYPFTDATEIQKGELLKDILAFANAWRQSDAHILIGVEEVRGGRSIPRGVSAHLLDRHLQQFVNSKTNRPVTFSYSSLKFEDLDIGVLELPQQDRPVYLLKDYGKLRANVVYTRRGDTTAEATPDEVVRMASIPHLHGGQPVLELEFADPDTRHRFGQRAELLSQSLQLPRTKSIPLYGEPADTQWGFSVGSMDALRNREFYRELAEYLRESTYLCSVMVALNNPSTTVAQNAIVTLRVESEGVSILANDDLPVKPLKSRTFLGRPRKPLQAQRIEVGRFGDVYEVRALVGSVQPGTTAWAVEPFYVGARSSILVRVEVEISANNLRIPIRSVAEIDIEARAVKATVAELKAFGDSE
jgi:hypothetical protein